ncbi:Type I secretion system ATP-binding protein PrsD [Roseovarius litorisediminis]|uniref:Type I secretion system ATP-binding protein PrsD n=2 Tax=Roseovarius litorisediminis TaxID=1312363 RepID=A0A1Y5T4T1_9RHOB|nr:Type I secretion system ATP-binding protein PrsD [Roseovarius litorisediminis]
MPKCLDHEPIEGKRRSGMRLQLRYIPGNISEIVSILLPNSILRNQKSSRSHPTAMKPQVRPGFPELHAARRRGTKLFVWAFIFSVFVNLLMLTGPLYMLQVYDRVLSSRSIETLVALSILVAALYVLMGVLDFARGRVMARVGARFQTALDGRLFDATLYRSADPKDHAASRAALRDLDSVQSLFVSPVLLALFDMPWTPFFIAAIFLFHPMLGWLAVAGGLMIVAIALANQLLTSMQVRMAQGAAQRAHTFADQARSGGEVVLSQGLAPNMRLRYIQLRNAALGKTVSANDWTGSFTSVTKSFRLFLQSAMLGAGAYYVIKGEMSAGSMIAGSILLGRALSPIEQSMGSWPVLQRAKAGWRSLGQYLASVPPLPKMTELPVPDAHLSAKNLTVIPPGERAPTLRNINFELRPGEALGVIGRSGSGKSTLARTLSGYWPIAAGEARLGGATLDQYIPDRLGAHIGYLPQAISLFPGTVAENIARMAIDPDSKMVVKAAQQANAHDMITQLPKGYDTFLDGNENQLSGGQRQRIALARALFGDPVLLILDEPNSMLDAEGSDALNRTVKTFKLTGRSVILMTHRPAAIAECDLLMVIDKGMATAFGPRDEVMEKKLKNVEPLRKSISAKVSF